MKILFGVILAALSVMVCGAVMAEGESAVSLVSAKSLKCEFSEASSGEWSGKNVSVVTSKEKMNLHFDSINVDAGTARAIGNQGADDVLVILTLSGLTFMERTGIGSLVVTTVFAEWVPGTRDFYAVMSRHIAIPGQSPIPSQYHGKCKVWQ